MDWTKPTFCYPPLSRDPNYPKIEDEILRYWKAESIFSESITTRNSGEYVFYDGPPFANGLPHYGHLLTGFIKDTIPRYQTMKGLRVERRFGWDCHGLPAEMESERELGISGQRAIVDFGIDKFNAHCQASVLRYTKEWETFVTRQARWVDFENDYKTMDISYMESVLWAFKRLWSKGLITEGHRVMPYSWAVESPLSNFETRLDNAYRERQDPALTVRFTLSPSPNDPGPLDILAWTTTPWTLPSNLALAVGEEIDYSIYTFKERFVILATASVERYQSELDGEKNVGNITGKDLINREYEPLFPFFANIKPAFVVLSGDFVTTTDGTGVVHCAPGFGEDDFDLCTANGVPIICPVDSQGRFTSEVSPYQSIQVFDANKLIIKDLKAAGKVVRHETYLHNYPHCWRTDTPLIYKAVSSWFVKVSEFKDRMVELNQSINWIPSHIRDGQFGKWLENARDWSISRTRFWGTPLPVWRSDNPAYPRTDVYGSIAELENDFGVTITDLHRPAIDQLIRPNPNDPTGQSIMRRVPEVFDCWFESGSMPFAQIHYPFENKEWFEQHFPADFIVEYVAQTRGWFYTLMVLGTALFDKPPFKTCMCHGLVLDEEGKKLSKRLRNYPSPDEVFDKLGADALRWFLISSPIIRGSDLLIDREGKGIAEIVRTVLNPLWNAAYFFTLYANTDGVIVNHDHAQTTLAGKTPPNYRNSLLQIDEYILAKLRILIEETDLALTNYDIPKACEEIKNFLDVLTNWYIRRSRERFWDSGISEKKLVAYETLFLTLIALCRVAAPILPLLSEHLYRTLTGKRSVHLESWPLATTLPDDKALIRAMDLTREICSAGLSIRESEGLRTRLPLEKVILAGKSAEQLNGFTSLIAEELNVKSVILEKSFTAFAEEQLQLNSRVLGPRLGNEMKNLLHSSKTGNWHRSDDGQVICNGIKLDPSEYSIRLAPKISDQAEEGQVCVASISQNGNSLVIALSVSVTPELEREGVARDLVRHIQQARKDANLEISDHINLTVYVKNDTDSNVKDSDVKDNDVKYSFKNIVKEFSDYISSQTLAASISIAEGAEVIVNNLNSTTEYKTGEVIVSLSNQPEGKIYFVFSPVTK